MASVSRSRFFRACSALFLFSPVFLVGMYGISLLVESVDGHGSTEGNTLLFVLGIILLLLFSCTFAAGALYLTSTSLTSGNKNS